MSVIGISRQSEHLQAVASSPDLVPPGTPLAQQQGMLLTLSIRSAIIALGLSLISSVVLAADADPSSAGTLSLASAVSAPADTEQSSATLAAAAAPATQVSKPNSTGLRYSLYASFAALQAMDAHSTLKVLRSGGHEANPFMSGVASQPAAFIAMKAGTAAATIFLAEKLSKKNPVASILLMTAVNTAYATVVAHNYRIPTR